MRRIRGYTLLLLIFLLLLFLTPQLAVSVEPPDVTYLSSLSGGLHTPIRIAADAAGRVYVTDTRGHRVCILDASGKPMGYIYGIEAPLGIAIDSENKIYVGDRQTGSVAIFTANSDIPIGKLGIGDGQFVMPTDIAIDSQNNIYVVDSKENCVKVFDENGDYEFQFGDSILTFPTGIAIDETNDAILVGQYGALEADKNASKVQIFDLKGNWKGSIGGYGSGAGEFTRIQGIAVDKRGRIYVADCFQSTVQVVDYDGIGLSFIGSYGTDPGELRVPSDVAFDRYNRLWVTSSNNKRIEVFGIDEYSLPGNKRPTGSKSGFKINLAAGVNLVSVPLKPPTEWKLSDLAAHIGDGVMSITTYAPDKKQFLSYLPSFAENESANAPVKGNTASIIVMKEGKEVEFQGTAWEGEVEFISGLNMFAVPRKPTVEWQLSDLAQHIGKELVYLIAYNRNSGRFETYFPDTASLSSRRLEAGAGYFAFMSKPKTVLFDGEAWQNQPLSTAPSMADNSNTPLSETPLLVVTGEVLNAETDKRLKNSNIEIKNMSTGMAQTAMANSDGSYVLTFVDFSGNRAAKVGDVLKVKAMDKDGQWISQTTTYTLTAEDIRMHRVVIPTIQLEIIPQKSVLLPSYPNPSNPETWIPFRLSRDAEVKIEIYNVAGQLVRTLNLGRKEAGNYISRQRAAHWDGSNDIGETVTSGLYFYTLCAGEFKATRRTIILK